MTLLPTRPVVPRIINPFEHSPLPTSTSETLASSPCPSATPTPTPRLHPSSSLPPFLHCFHAPLLKRPQRPCSKDGGDRIFAPPPPVHTRQAQAKITRFDHRHRIQGRGQPEGDTTPEVASPGCEGLAKISYRCVLFVTLLLCHLTCIMRSNHVSRETWLS